MNIYVDFQGITRFFQQAQQEQRNFLFEHEVYNLIRLTGSETAPRHFFLPKEDRLQHERILSIPGDHIVLKIVSPFITHKSDIGGVRIISKEPEKILSTIRGMLYEIPEAYAANLERHPEYAPPVYKGLHGETLISAIFQDIQGILLCQRMPVSQEFGNELLLSLRRTREFGMIISAGLGGTDTELYAERLKKGHAVVAASTEMTDGEIFFRFFRETISYKALAGLTRGHKRIVTDEQLLECFSAFIALGNYFSPSNPDAPFVIEDLEINPFAFAEYLMLPLDGLCRFSLPGQQSIPRPIEKIDKLLHPASIGIIGVSAKTHNVGRIILQNVLANGFSPSKIRLIHPHAQYIDEVAAIPSLEAIQEKLDLLILAVSANQLSDLVKQVIKGDLAESVILVPGGMGEVHGSEQESQSIQQTIAQAHLKPGGGPVFLGANSLGVLSHPGQYDSMFIPETLLPKDRGTHARHSVIISQSGGYIISRMSDLSFLDPAYTIAIGNQFDLTASDFVGFLNANADIHIVAAYMEGFNDLDGLAFAKAVREAVIRGKEVIFYKAGRTPEGKTATSGHTASVAGEYMVCESCIRQAGAMVADTFTEFGGLLRLSHVLHHKTLSGNRVAAISNAGYEAVGMADNILGEDYILEMAVLSPETIESLKHVLHDVHLEELVNVKNPLDLTPMATEAEYERITQIFLQDPDVDMVVVGITPLTPLIRGLSEGIAAAEFLLSDKGIVGRLARLSSQFAKPLIIVIDSGPRFDYLANIFQKAGLPVFRSADRAMQVLGKYTQGRLRAQRIIVEKEKHCS